MISAKGQVIIRCSPDQVYAALADPSSIPRWRPDILEVHGKSGNGVGARYDEVISFFGKKHQTFEVVEAIPGRRWVVRAVAGLALRPTQAFELAPCPAGTRLSWDIALPVTGGFRLMSPLLGRMIPRKWVEYGANLAKWLEVPE